LGDRTFIENIISPAGTEIKELPRKQRYKGWLKLDHIFTASAMEHKDARDAMIRDAFTRYGCYTLKEIADHLGIHYSTVSRAVKRIDAVMCYCKT